MKYIFNQYQGLGDILFCEPIARNFHKEGKNEIFWPINDEFMWLTNYIKDINFVPKSRHHMNYESLHLGLLIVGYCSQTIIITNNITIIIIII